MKLDSLKYAKDKGSRDTKVIEKHVETTTSSPREQISRPTVELPPDYTKPEGKMDVRILFILSGGENRERNYFKMLRDDHRLQRIKVAFASKKGQGLNPTQLLEVANKSVDGKRFIAEEATYRFEKDNGDILYLLQDIDEFEQEILFLATEEQPDCIRWIYSNPAFEMWLFYHYFNQPLPELQDAIGKTPAERSQWLKKHLSNSIRGGLQTTKAIALMRTAIDNSKANYQEKKGLPDLFSTRMHILAEDILDTMGEEFDLMLERKAAFNKAMMEKYRKPIIKNIRYDGEKIRSLTSALSEWAESHPLMLPCISDDGDNGSLYSNNRLFPLSYKIEKAYLDDNSGTPMPVNTDELFMENIQNEIYRFYHILFIQNSPIASYTIDFSEITNAIDLLGLDSQYAILTSFHINALDIYTGEPLHETDWGYQYKDLTIYKIRAHGRFMIIMRKEYLPKADFKPYKSDNNEYEQIDGKNFIYSNIHQMKDLGDAYGLSVMRVVQFLLPPKGSFLFVKLNIVDYHKEKSEFDKLSKADVVKLQYQEGDFVAYKNKVYQILHISKDGEIYLSFVEKAVSLSEIAPVRIDGIEDADIYYDPIVAAFTIAPGAAIPSVTVNDQYYMESFKNEVFEDGTSLYDKVSEFNFTYVHVLQHWLIETQGQSGLKING